LPTDRAWKWAVAILLPVTAVVIMAVAWFSKEEESPAQAGGTGAMGQTGMPSGDIGGMELMNQVQREIDALKATLKQNPNHASALLRLANLYHDAGMYPQAIDYYTKLLAVDSTQVDARVDMGTCYFESGQPQEAIRQVEIALNQNPTHRNALYNLGVIQASTGNVEEARRYWNRVIELYPESETAAHAKENLKRL
jgi:tetratricopeptide (TPR) repeat protein